MATANLLVNGGAETPLVDIGASSSYGWLPANTGKANTVLTSAPCTAGVANNRVFDPPLDKGCPFGEHPSTNSRYFIDTVGPGLELGLRMYQATESVTVTPECC